MVGRLDSRIDSKIDSLHIGGISFETQTLRLIYSHSQLFDFLSKISWSDELDGFDEFVNLDTSLSTESKI